MTLPVETVNRIAELGHFSEAPKIIQLPGDRPHISYHRLPNGELQALHADPPHRSHKLDTIETLIDFVKANQRLTSGDDVVFYDSDNVEYVFDQSGFERATVPLVPSEEYQFILQRLREPNVGVKDLSKALRTTMRATLDADRRDELVRLVGKLNVKNETTGAAASARGRDTLGVSVDQQIESELPDEEQVFSVRRWANADLDIRNPIQVILDPSTTQPQWEMRPVQESVEVFKHLQLAHIGKLLHDGLMSTQVSIYQGRWEA